MQTTRYARRIGSGLLAWSCGALWFVGSASAQAPAPDVAADHAAVLQQYCVTCHNERLRTAGLALDQLDMAHAETRPDVWEKVVQKLRSRTMPPARRPRPDDATYDAVATWLEASLDRAAADRPNPGRPLLHRMNRTEYRNAVRDLLAVDADVSALPADDATYGFDNIADALGTSPLLLESYVTTARKVARMAIGSPAIPPITTTYKTPEDLTQDYHLRDLPLGTRGGLVVDEYLPVDADYELRVRLRRGAGGSIRGISEQHYMELTLDGERIGLFAIGSEDAYRATVANKNNPGQTANKAFTADEHMRVRLPIAAGDHTIIAAFVGKPAALAEQVRRPFLRSYVASSSRTGLPEVDRVLIAGPFEAARPTTTPSRERIFSCQPAGPEDEPACARAILSRLGRLAYRRPLEATELDKLLAFYDEGRLDGGFEAGVELALRFVLASPQFIFRLESEPADLAAGEVYPLADLDLASRLSFFLWSSGPDDALLAAAEQGQLSDPEELARQVRRMLADPRADALVENFAGQWLYLRNLDSTNPDPLTFPDFDDNLRRSLQRETELFFSSILREDRSVLDLLTADYTFVNERLGATLRHRGDLRRPVPAGAGDPGAPAWAARPREHPDGHVVRDADVAGAARQVDSGEPAGRTAPAPAAGHPGPRGQRKRRGVVGAGAADAAPCEPGMRRLPRADGSLRLRVGELRRDRAVARHRRRRCGHRRRGTRCPMVRRSMARVSSGRRSSSVQTSSSARLRASC